MLEINFLTMILQSSWVIKIVLALLLFLSLASWTIIFSKWSQFSRTLARVSKDRGAFDSAHNLSDAIQILRRKKNSPANIVVQEGVGEITRLKEMGWVTTEKASLIMDNIRASLEQERDIQVEELFGSLSFLATCVNVSPFLGLFGTVWGIMHSFYVIGKMKTANIAAVAPGLAEALITTAIGLAVAIPASLAFNFLVKKLGGIEQNLQRISQSFMNRVKREMLSKSPGTK